jgi:phosphohistidine phosphatase SixA
MKRFTQGVRVMATVAVCLAGLALTGRAAAQVPTGDALLHALRQGGCVIVMRHASSPRQVPDKATANADNVNLERQLDEAGRTSATAMGNALRDLKIPVGRVFTSPTYRAMETVRLAKLANVTPVPELGDGGQSMQGVSIDRAGWLQKKAAEFQAGTNTLMVTHQPNLTGAFAALATGVADGEALIFVSDGKGGATLAGRIKIDEWPRMK